MILKYLLLPLQIAHKWSPIMPFLSVSRNTIFQSVFFLLLIIRSFSILSSQHLFSLNLFLNPFPVLLLNCIISTPTHRHTDEQMQFHTKRAHPVLNQWEFSDTVAISPLLNLSLNANSENIFSGKGPLVILHPRALLIFSLLLASNTLKINCYLKSNHYSWAFQTKLRFIKRKNPSVMDL